MSRMKDTESIYARICLIWMLEKSSLKILSDEARWEDYFSVSQISVQNSREDLNMFAFHLKVVPGPEADVLMKSWVAEREEER
jgi:hypothetical protein